MPWVWFVQLTVPLLAVLVAYAVYRIQADKLFLDMRVERMTVWTAYREARNARYSYCLTTVRVKYDEAAFTKILANHKDACEALLMWFGDELSPHVQALDRLLDQWLSYNLGVAGQGGEPDAQRIGDFLNRAEALSLKQTAAIRPYIVAGRRGLPLSQAGPVVAALGRFRLKGRKGARVRPPCG